MPDINAITHQQYIEKFKQYAEEHVDIAHKPDAPRFIRTNIEEATTSHNRLLSGGSPMMIMLDLQGSVRGQEGNYMEVINAGFLLIEPVPMDDFDAEQALYDKLKTIGWDIVARIKHEREEGVYWRHFDILSVRTRQVGPILDNAFGYEFTFSLYVNRDIKYQAEKWTAAESNPSNP